MSTGNRPTLRVVAWLKPGLSPARRTIRPPSGTLPPSEVPGDAELCSTGGAGTAEDVVAGLDGALVCGFTGGAIVRLDPHAGTLTTVADTGGRAAGS